MAIKLGMICIGEELLDGRTQEKNAAHLMGWCADKAAVVRQVWIIGDEPSVIVETLDAARRSCDLVLVSGGLGPTQDDMTRDAAAAWAGQPLETDEALVRTLEERFASFGRPFTANNRRQCMFPRGARILSTEVGTAAGFALDGDDGSVLFFPGVPSEFRWFVDRYVPPMLGPSHENPFVRARFAFFGLGESQIEDRLEGIEALAEEVHGRIGYRAAFPIVEVIVKAPSASALEPLSRFVDERLCAWLVGRDGESIHEHLAARLLEAKATVAVAESCTAGALGAALTELSGSSAWFERGYLTYANAAKVEELGVATDVLALHGAVSAEVVCQMAAGARERARSTFALAISGIAGPTGGTDEKPVGTVHFGLATAQGVYHFHGNLGRFNRQGIRKASVYTAMALLIWHLEDKLTSHDVHGPYGFEAVRRGQLLEP